MRPAAFILAVITIPLILAPSSAVKLVPEPLRVGSTALLARALNGVRARWIAHARGNLDRLARAPCSIGCCIKCLSQTTWDQHPTLSWHGQASRSATACGTLGPKSSAQ